MPKPAVRVVGSKRCGRAVLLRTTALQAAAYLVISLPAAAQPAPNARPQGGQVTAGTASIAGSATTTTINQSTARAAIDWTRFDVGSAQSVTFNQPSSAAVTLNRVTGPDPSAVAGRITANGQIVLTNPSGVVFYKGAEVNAQSVVISAAGISNQNFMAGRMAFDQPANPGARIENRGTITVKQAGLAALVAPAVANSGVINARLARVVLAGAQTHTLDLYGDGLVAIDVTGQVRQAPRGADGKPVSALVTNTGAILADGGVVQLTAAAADGVVQTLVDAGGRVQANTAAGEDGAGRTGRILITGTGGSVVVEGRIAADGRMAGSTGGQVEIHGDAATTIASGARVSVSGRAGGGTAAIGTTLARAVTTGAATPGTSARTTVAAGARIAADATARGQGGRVTVLSTQDTRIAGTLTARGGRQGGDGGMIEMSGERGFSLTGTANASAPHGALGTILLDPTDLTIVGNGATGTIVPTPGADPNIAYTDAPGSSVTVREADVEALAGNIHLQATNNLSVNAPLTLGAQNLTLDAGNTLTVSAGFTVQAAGQITLSAGTPGFNPAGALSILGTVRSTGSNAVNVQLNAAGGITIGGVVDAGGRLGVSTTGSLTQTSTSQVIASDLVGNAASVSLASTTNQIASVGGLSNFATTGTFTLATGGGLTIPAGSILQTARAISLTAGAAGGLTISGTVRATGGEFQTVILNAGTGGISIGGLVDAASPLVISTTGVLAETGSGQVNTSGLTGTAASVSLLSTTNQVAGVGTQGRFSTTSGDFALVDGVALTVGTISPPGGIAVPSGHTMTLATDSLTINPSFGGAVLSAPSGTIVIAPLTIGRPVELTSSGTKTPGTLSLTTTELGGMSAGTLQLGQLDIAGNPTAGPVSIGRSGDAASIDLGSLGFSALAVYAVGAVTQTVPLGVSSFQGQGGSLALTNAANFIGTLNGFTTSVGNLDFHTGGSLAVTGAVSAQGGLGNVFLSSAAPAFNTPTLTLAANVTGSTVNLNSLSGGDSSGGGISQTGGIITATTLTGAGYFARLGNANQVAQLSNFAVNTDLSLTTAQALSLTGAIAAQTVTLTAPGITQLATSSLSAGELDGASSADVLLTSTANQVAAMGAFTMTGGNFTLVTGSPALQFGAGTVDAGAGSLTFIADSVTLGRATLGTINAPSGTVTFAPFTASRPIELIGAPPATAGTLSLNSAFTSRITAATLALGNGAATGAITLGRAGETVSLRGQAGTLDLATSGAVSQGSGAALDVAALTGRTGDVTLGGANTIDTLGAYAVSSGGFVLNDAAPLTIAGPVNGGAAAAITAPGLTVSGSVAAASSLVLKASAADLLQTAGLIQTTSLSGPGLELDSPAAVRQTGGSIATLTALTGTAGTAALVSAANSVPTLQRYTTAGDFALTDAAPLTVLGVLNSGGSVSLQTAGALAIDNTVTGHAGMLVSGGAITQTAVGPLTLTSLAGSAGSVDLTQAANFIGTLSGFTSSAGFSLATGALSNANTLAVSGPVTAGTSIILNNYGPLTLAGTVQAPLVAMTANSTQTTISGTILNTDGTITQAGGRITAAPGGGLPAGSISLTAGDALNQAAGAIVATGPNSQASLASHGTLSLGGTVTGATVNLIAMTRSIPASPYQSAQTNPGVVSQPGGAITGGLVVQADAATLASAANAVSSLGAVINSGAFALTDGVPLTVTLPVSSPAAVGLTAPGIIIAASVTSPAITLDATTGSLAQTAGVIGASGTLTLLAAGAAGQTGGSLAVGTLTGSTGSTAFTQRGNSVDALAAFAATGDFTLVDSAALNVTGAVAVSAGHTLTLIDDTPAFALGGSLAAPAGTVSLQEYTVGRGVTLGAAGVPPVTAATLSVGSLTGGPVSIVGAFNLTGVGVLDLLSGGAITETGAGALQAGTLAGSGASASLSGANRIGTLAGFTTAGAFSLTDAQALTVTGPLAAGTTVSLDITGDLVLASSVTAPAGLTLAATGAIDQTAGVIATASLSGSAASASLTGANQVATLAGFTTAGAFSLTDAQALTVTGPLAAGTTASLDVTGNLVLASNVTAAIGLTLGATGAIDQTAGAVATASLSGSAASASLSGANRIGTLAGFTTAGAFSLTDAQALTVAGPLTAGATASLDVTGDLVLNSSVTAPAGLTLAAAGAIGQTAGVVATASLSGSAASASLTGANQVATLAGFTTAGAFSLTDTQALTVTGPLAAGITASLDVTGDLVLNSSVTAATGLTLATTGAINQTAGVVATASLSGSAASASLSGANRIGTLAGFPTTGAFSLTDAQALTVAGPLAAGATASLDITGDLVLAGSVTAPAGLTLAATGAIDQTAGGIATASLSGSAASAGLTGANRIGTLAGFTTAGAFSLTDTQALTVAGPLTAGTTASLDITGNLVLASNVAGTAVNLLATGAITEGTGGSVSAGVLSITAGSATLAGSNAVATLGNVTTQTGFSLVDGRALTVAGPVSDSVSIGLQSTGLLTLAGPLSAPTVSLASVGPGGISQSGGVITAGLLTGSATGAVSLDSTNAVSTLGSFASVGGFALNTGALTLTGPLTDPTSVSLATGALTLNGVVTTPTLTLASGAVTQPGGALAVGTLSGTAASAALTQRGNSVDALGAFTSAGDFALVDGAAALSVGGAVSVGAGHALTLTNDAPSLAFGGALAAPGGTVFLQEYTAGHGVAASSVNATVPITAATLVVGTSDGGPVAITGAFNLPDVGVLDLLSAGAITETGAGSLQVAALEGSGGSANLAGTNRIGTLAGFTTVGAFSLANAQDLRLAAPLAAGSASLTVTGDLALASSISAPAALSLSVTGAISQTAGTLTTASLSGRAASASLTDANQVATLGPFTTTGDFTLFDGRSLTVVAAVDPGVVTMNVMGDLVLNSSVTGTAVNLLATGVITEGAGGSITAGTLTANARSATLTGANAVTVLGNVNTQAGFSLVDGIALTVAGPVNDRASIALQSTGLLTLAGPLSAPTVSLASSGGITQAGGVITAGTLTGSAAGPVSLGASGNAIVNLGAFVSAGFNLNDGVPLTLTGALTDTVGVSLTTGALALNGVVSAPTLTLASGAVTQPGGALAVGVLSGTAASAAFTQRGNSVGALGAFTSSGDFSLVDGMPLTIGAPVTAGAGHTLTLAADALTFAPGGSLAAPGGTVNLQEYTAGQGVTLDAATVGPITAATLAIGGPTGGPVTITGAFALSGAGVLDLLSAGVVTETGAGSLQADTLAGNAGSASLSGANRIGTVAGFTTTGAFNLNDTQALSVTGPLAAGSLTLAAPGVTLAGGVRASSLTVMTSGNLMQTGGKAALGRLDGAVGQAVDLGTGGSLALAQLGSLSAGGSLSLVDGAGLTLAGALSAPNLAISATGTMTLMGGSITTTGLPPAQESGATPATPGSFLQVLAGPDGYGQFVQTGTTLVQPLSGGVSTLRIGLPAAGGSLTLAGLQAPRTTIILALGNGTATGTISVGDLLVLGAGGAATLTGEVRHLTGFDASQVSHINPAVSQQYQLNGCAIASSNCLPASAILTPLAALLAVTASGTSSGPGRSILRPDILTLDVLDLSVTRDRDDPTLLLPNISDRDY